MAVKGVMGTKDAAYDLIRRAQNGEEEAREQMILENTGLVKSIALKFTGSSYELDDLLQLGFIGLLKAVERFDPSYDVMFSTYAVPMIMGEIKRHMRDDGKIKMGRQLKQDVKRLKQAEEEFCQSNGRSPAISELAQQMELTVDEILTLVEARDAMHNMVSLDDPEHVETAGNQMAREDEDQRVNLIYLKSVIGDLEKQERQIIILRYFKDMTQQQIADLLRISQVQVSRIEKRILTQIRKKMTS